MVVELFIFWRFKRLTSGENIFKSKLHLAEEKIVTYLLEAHLGFLADISRFIDIEYLSSLPSKVQNPRTCSFVLNLS